MGGRKIKIFGKTKIQIINIAALVLTIISPGSFMVHSKEARLFGIMDLFTVIAGKETAKMRNKMLKTIIPLLGLVIVAGCGKSDNDDISDKLKDKVTAVQEQGKTDEKLKPSEEKGSEQGESSNEKVPDKEGQKETPVLVMHRDSKYEWGDGSVPRIKHTYGYLLSGDEYAKYHKSLTESLEKARDEILAKQKAAWDDEQKKIKEDERMAYEESWNTYLRRADDDVVSFVNEYCTVGQFDDGYYTSFIGHSFYTDSGKEISLTDIVADEEAFYDLMADRMSDYIEPTLKNIYADDVDFDRDKFRSDMVGYLEDEGITWTLDPQGVTFWMDSYISLPEGFSTTVLFTDDKDGTIFNEEFAKNVPDEWISQSPEIIGSFFDIDDSGKPEFVHAYPLYEMREFEDSEEFFINRYEMRIGSAEEEITLDMPGGTDFIDFFFVHKDGRTFILESAYEYDSLSTYTFTVDGIRLEEGGFLAARFETIGSGGETYNPYYIPTDLSNIRMILDPKGPDGGGTCTISIDAGGKIKKTGDSFASSAKDLKEQEPFFGLWVGAYKERLDAETLVAKLEDEGLPASYVYSCDWENLNKDPYYCVSIGRSGSEEEAQAYIADAKKAGYPKAYVKYTGEKLGHRVNYTVFDESGIDISSSKAVLKDVTIDDFSGDDTGEATLIVDKDTVFDKTCDMQFFPYYQEGDSPLEWFNHISDIRDSAEYQAQGGALRGVFEVDITGNHVDRYYGSYWWD